MAFLGKLSWVLRYEPGVSCLGLEALCSEGKTLGEELNGLAGLLIFRRLSGLFGGLVFIGLANGAVGSSNNNEFIRK